MPEVTALFWDVGGVILSNGWDREERAAAIKHFGLDADEFRASGTSWSTRHSRSGQMSLDDYLERTVFYCPRTFSREEFKAFLFAQSTENRGTRAVLDEVDGGGPLSAGHPQQ